MITLKSKREIEMIRASAGIVKLVHSKLHEMIKPGISTQELDSDTAANTAALNCKLHHAHPDDTVASNFCRYIVTLNEHAFGDSLAGI